MNVDADPLPRHRDGGAADEVCGMQDRAGLRQGQLREAGDGDLLPLASRGGVMRTVPLPRDRRFPRRLEAGRL
jgi:hypothetical protein